MRLLIFLMLLINSAFSQNKVFISNKYLNVKHVEWVNIYQLFKDGDINLLVDTPFSKANSVVFQMPWCLYYDFNEGRFSNKKESNKRKVSLKRTYTFYDDQIYDSEYSKFNIKGYEKDESAEIYFCDDVSGSTRESGLGCLMIFYKDYLFIQYRKETSIFSK